MRSLSEATEGQLKDWERRLWSIVTEMEAAEKVPSWQCYDDKMSTLVRYAHDEVRSVIDQRRKEAIGAL